MNGFSYPHEFYNGCNNQYNPYDFPSNSYGYYNNNHCENDFDYNPCQNNFEFQNDFQNQNGNINHSFNNFDNGNNFNNGGSENFYSQQSLFPQTDNHDSTKSSVEKALEAYIQSTSQSLSRLELQISQLATFENQGCVIPTCDEP